MTKKSFHLGIVGSGPAALMAATVAVRAGVKVSLFERKPGPARKLLIAGSSGLNITYDEPDKKKFSSYYKNSEAVFENVFSSFSQKDWIAFVESLGIKTFKGTSRRYFVEGMKASTLVRAWMNELNQRGVVFFPNHCLADFKSDAENVTLFFENGLAQTFDFACLALGSFSYEPEESAPSWPRLFSEKNISMIPFAASNAGFEVDWPEAFLKEAEGLPLKNTVCKSSRGSRQGDLIITRYGLEGTPIYTVGEVGELSLDLFPDLPTEALKQKLRSAKENLSPLRRIKKTLKLSKAHEAFLFHLAKWNLTSEQSTEAQIDLISKELKAFKVALKKRRPMSEAISCSGGVSLRELSADLELLKHPRVYLAGEMLDWDTVTGGFLIQGCVSMGAHVAFSALKRYVNQV